jgi:hypothetical protein
MKFSAFKSNLVRVYMKCDYTPSNHNLLMLKKKQVVQSIRVLSVYWMLSARWVGCVYGKKKINNY